MSIVTDFTWDSHDSSDAKLREDAKNRRIQRWMSRFLVADKISINTPALEKPDLIGDLAQVRQLITIALIASGGAGKREHFDDVLRAAGVDGTLTASVFHSGNCRFLN